MHTITRSVRPYIIIVALLSAAVGVALLASESRGHSGHSFSAAALFAPTIDGKLAVGEWDDADCQTNQVRADNGDISNLTICVKNNEVNLYMAVQATNQDYSDPNEPCFDFLNIGFDDNHNGRIEGSGFIDGSPVRGEDGLALRFDGAAVYDMFNPGVTFGYWGDDIDDGTHDVTAAVTHSNPGPNTIGTYTAEYAHPLDTTDNAHDFSLAYGDTIGFVFRMSDGDPSPSGCGGALGSFDWPSSWPTHSPGWADITIATPIPSDATPIEITIQPGGNPNSINCTAEQKVISVGILTTSNFDATSVDHASVIFSRATETHLDTRNGKPRRHVEDVDNDGDADLLFHFRLSDTSLTCASVGSTLIGETFGGETVVGTGPVHMVDRGNKQ